MNNPNQNDPSTTLGVGGVTSGQEGASPTRETQQETGGSGGDGLTRNQAGETTNAPSGAPGRAHAEAPDSAMTHAGRGPQDTRPNQADPNARTGTGLGTPETGGNQDASDLPPPR
ncbi:hypothetical protein [Massilia sp. BKSP1R2A-1]|jgi:hypothetical protein|uniref:hypothetical protein n=1 Tax=Massilia sp. BKSP1R2A-1 TaxID=3422595 RepID=UPI003D332C22